MLSLFIITKKKKILAKFSTIGTCSLSVLRLIYIQQVHIHICLNAMHKNESAGFNDMLYELNSFSFLQMINKRAALNTFLKT